MTHCQEQNINQMMACTVTVNWYCMTCGINQSIKKEASYSIAHDFTRSVACHWHLSNSRSVLPATAVRMANAWLTQAVLWQYYTHVVTAYYILSLAGRGSPLVRLLKALRVELLQLRYTSSWPGRLFQVCRRRSILGQSSKYEPDMIRIQLSTPCNACSPLVRWTTGMVNFFTSLSVDYRNINCRRVGCYSMSVSPSSESPNILCRSYSYRVASAPRGLDGHACAASRLSFIGLRLY